MSRKNEVSGSGFMKSLGAYSRPVTGELLDTENGKAKILDIIGYREVVREMRENGIKEEEIDRFISRVENFLGRKERYFECELAYPNGETERIDWSEYLALKNIKKR